MKKIIIALLVMFTGLNIAFAMDKIKITPDAQRAINMYKKHNYSACIQSMQKVIDEEQLKDLSIAHYYMGNAYVKLGRADKAIASYGEVINLNTSPGLVEYAKQGTQCLNNIEECRNIDNIDGFARSNISVHPKIYYDLEAKEVETVKQDMTQNSGKDQSVNFNKYKYLNDAKDEMPSDKEIADAVKTLAKVGFAPYGTNFDNQNIAQLNMLLGQSGYNSNYYNNMLPYIMAQNNNSNSSEASKKQMIQMMMLNQMPTGF